MKIWVVLSMNNNGDDYDVVAAFSNEIEARELEQKQNRKQVKKTYSKRLYYSVYECELDPKEGE